MLVRTGDGDQDGIIALGGFVRNDPEHSSYAQEYFAGLLDRGFWRTRPEDSVGFLFSYIAMSGALGKVQAAESEAGIPFSNAATGVQTHEMILEVDYNIHVYRGVDFRPDLQYVIGQTRNRIFITQSFWGSRPTCSSEEACRTLRAVPRNGITVTEGRWQSASPAAGSRGAAAGWRVTDVQIVPTTFTRARR